MAEKIATMDGVTESRGHEPVELWEDDGSLWLVTAEVPDIYNCCEINLIEVLGWLRAQRHTAVGERIRQITDNVLRETEHELNIGE